MWSDLEPLSLMVGRSHLSKSKVLYLTWKRSHYYTCLFFVETWKDIDECTLCQLAVLDNQFFKHWYQIVSTLDVDKFGGLASCITTFGFILVPIERLRVVNNNSSCIGMWSSSSSRSYMIFIHNFMKVSMEPSSFVMIPLFWDTKFSCLLKSYKCCLSQHVKNAINNPTCITHHSQFCHKLFKYY